MYVDPAPAGSTSAPTVAKSVTRTDYPGESSPLVSDMSESMLRHSVRAAASVLLIASGVHATAHYRVYVSGDGGDAAQHALMAAMQAYEILPRWHVTAWTMLAAYSLCFAILLMFAGTLLWWMGKELPATRLRPFASGASLVLFVGVALLALLAPAPVQMSILLIAALCLGAGSVFGANAMRLLTKPL